MHSVPKLVFGLVAVMLFALVFARGGGALATVLSPALAMFALGLLTAWLIWGLGPRRA